jgi:hypothetical protein
MSESFPEQETLSTIELHGRSLQHWIDWLSRDPGQVPCSRYGRYSDECAPYAVAAEWAFVSNCGDDHEGQIALDWLMGLTVNDHDDIAYMIREHGQHIPQALRDCLDEDVIGGTDV